MSFGGYVKKLRLDRGISQRVLAEKIGVTFPYISKIENDNVMIAPSEEILQKMAIHLEVDSDALFIAARKIPTEISEYITNDYEIIRFLRKSKGKDLTSCDWKRLSEIVDDF